MKHTRYTDAERAEAVLILRTEGYPDKPGALARAARDTGIAPTVLRRWAMGTSNPPPSEVVQLKQGTLSAKLDRIAHLYLDRAEETVSATTGAQAVTAAAIAIDKMRLLQGLPTQIVSVLPDFLGALRAMGIEPDEFIQRTIAKAELEAGFRRLGSGDR